MIILGHLDVTVEGRHRVPRLVTHRGQAEAGHIVQQLGGWHIEAGEDRLEEEAGASNIVPRDITSGETQPGTQTSDHR